VTEFAQFAFLSIAIVGVYYALERVYSSITPYLSLGQMTWLPEGTREVFKWAVLAICLSVMASGPIRWAYAWGWLYRWERNTPGSIGGEELLKHVQSMHTPGQLLRLLLILRSKRMIDSEGDTLAAMNDLFAISERMRMIERSERESAKARQSIGQRINRFVTFDDLFTWRARKELRQAWQGNRQWPPFDTAYTPPWMSRNAKRYWRFRYLLTNIDVVDEMSRIIDEVEATNAGRLRFVSSEKANAPTS
jgi:hypothetical protein